MEDVRQEIGFLIASLSAAKFRAFVVTFLKAKYSTKEVFITDGPYDGGLDIEIRLNGNTVKKNIQVTVQKENLEDKLKEDLNKSKENISKHGYQTKLDFYYNQALSRSKQEGWKTMAEIQYGIELTIYDGNALSQLSDDYPAMKEALFEMLNIKSQKNFFKIDEQTKVLFDALSLGKQTGEIKKQFIYSYIISFLYTNPESTLEAVKAKVSEQIPSLSDDKIYKDSLSALKGQGALVTDATKKLYSLAVEKHSEISKLYESNLISESLLRNSIQTILTSVQLESESENIASLLLTAYKENYKIDIDELEGQTLSAENSLKKIYADLKKHLTNRGLGERDADRITHELFEMSASNEYLNKIGAAMLFTNLYRSDKLEEYLNKKIHHYYFDTQVLLWLVCYQFEESDYEEIHYKSVRNLYETIKSFPGNVILSTSEDYLIEVAGHIQEALKLERFLALPILERLKSSNNVFFNYYKHLVKTHKLLEDLSLTDWFHEMLDMEDFPDYNNAGFTYTIARRLRRMYEMLNITVIYHGPYENFQAVKKAYEIELSYKNWPRPSMSIDNDVRSILYLASREHHVNAALGLRIEPFLVTWDNMFFAVRKAVLSNINRYLNLCNWFIYAPAKLADRLSVMNLKLNPKAIDYNIISVAETSFNLYNKGETFLDVLSTFFNRKNVSEMRLATKLLAMEEQTITEEPEKEQEFEKASPLTNILLAVRRHYVRTLEEFKFPDLIQVFENDAYEEPVIKIFENSLEEYNKNAGKLSDAIFIKFNELIKKFREGLTQQEPPQ